MSEENTQSRPVREAKITGTAVQPSLSGLADAMPVDGGESLEGGRFVRSANRKPFGSMVQKLAVPPRPGYHRHWFNEEPGRIDMAKENGWNHVLDTATGKPTTRVVNKGGLQAWLMEIPQVWFDEDMAAQQQGVDDKEKTIKRGQVDAADGRERDNHFYPTAHGRKIDIRQTMARRPPGT